MAWATRDGGLKDADLAAARKCAAGDELALREVVRMHQRLIFGLALRMVGQRQDAEDVAIRTFERFWRSARSFNGESSLKAYLCRICLNLCSDELKKRGRLPAVHPLDPYAETPVAMEGKPDIEDVLCAIRSLAAADREVLVLYYLDELSYEEIASAMSVSYDVLRTRLTRARARLRASLGVGNE